MTGGLSPLAVGLRWIFLSEWNLQNDPAQGDGLDVEKGNKKENQTEPKGAEKKAKKKDGKKKDAKKKDAKKKGEGEQN